jgi:hypothetical protein
MKRNDTKRRWRPDVPLGAVLALALGALVLAGCGGSGGGGSTETSTTTASTGGGEGPGMFNISEEARACLKEKGVEPPEFKAGEGPGGKGRPPTSAEGEMREAGPPTGSVGGGISEEQEKAFEECGVEMPELKAGPGGAGGPNLNSAAFQKQVKEYVACVRENGYELAEPDFSGEGPIFEKSESESSAFKKASAKCSNLFGGQRGLQSG